MLRVLKWFEMEIKNSSIDLRLSTEVTPEFIEENNPDVVVIGIGAEPIIPDVPGIGKDSVDFAINILSNIEKYKGKKAVVIGGGDVGCETACYLADNGFEVTIVEILDEILYENKITEIKLRLNDLIKAKNIKILTNVKLNAITDEGVEILVPYDTQMGLSEGGRQDGIEADVVALAVNQEPNNELINMFTMKAEEFYIIGDL